MLRSVNMFNKYEYEYDNEWLLNSWSSRWKFGRRYNGVLRYFTSFGGLYQGSRALTFCVSYTVQCRLCCLHLWSISIYLSVCLQLCTTVSHYVARPLASMYINITNNKKAELSQRWPRDAPYVWVPWKFSGVPYYTHGYFSRNFQWAFVPIEPINMRAKFEYRSFSRSWDNRGTRKNGQSLDTPTLHFL